MIANKKDKGRLSLIDGYNKSIESLELNKKEPMPLWKLDEINNEIKYCKDQLYMLRNPDLYPLLLEDGEGEDDIDGYDMRSNPNVLNLNQMLETERELLLGNGSNKIFLSNDNADAKSNHSGGEVIDVNNLQTKPVKKKIRIRVRPKNKGGNK